MPTSYSGKTGNFVRVNSVGNGLFFDSNVYITSGSAVNFSGNTISGPSMKNYSEVINIYGNSNTQPQFTVNDGNIVTMTLVNPVTQPVLLTTGLISGRSHSITFAIKQDSTGGRTIDWQYNTIKWPAGEGIYSPDGPTLSAEANYTDFVTLMTFDAGTTWYGVLAGKGFPA